ncbi:MAG: Adenylate cyclase 2 [Candidatus Heimdallarchaeota archaeon LC_3]|nr:MAG: Adenylate cyclase 2 [Candidatus Heimdallarchaeota archaeon LC_3]
MICNNCRAENRETAQFCMKCGNSLKNNCSNCGEELPHQAHFCIKCGTKVISSETNKTGSSSSLIEHYIPKELLKKIESAKSSGGIKNERRIVTILFSDLQGSTAAAEQLDPEEWAEIMNGAFEYLIKPVYKYEGIIARLMGDAILAFFGAPISHEDDPQRAVFTALEILDGIKPYLKKTQEKWNVDVDIRVGINTGLVVVGEIGTDMRVEYTAMGDAINLASRMESTAEPGTIQITEFTHKLIAPLFNFEEIGPMNLKGKSDPIVTYKVLSKKISPGKLRGLSGLESPLVGRDDEFNMIIGKISELINGTSNIISIIAEAGLGKSRLLEETHNYFHESQKLTLPDQPRSQVCWLQGVSLSYQMNSPYAPFIDMLTKFFKITPDLDNNEQYRLIKDKLHQFPECRSITPFIANFLHVKPIGEDLDRIQYLEPPTLREKTFESLLLFFEELSKNYSLILAFDDLHWVDQSSIDFIKSLTESTTKQPLIILVLFRPRKQERSWEYHEYVEREFSHNYTKINLETLDEADSKSLVYNLLKIEGLSNKIRNLILSKSEGNPFYIEEVIRTLIDKKLISKQGKIWQVRSEFDEISIPDTLTGILTARLDQLDDYSRNLVQIASVIGREFSIEILEDITENLEGFDQGISTLEKRELIILKGRIPNPVYIFKHVMIYDVVYNSLLRKTRMEIHSKVAKCIIKFNETNVDEIARHYFEGKDFSNALIYIVKAAHRASMTYSNQEAIELYNKALSIKDNTTDTKLINDIYVGLGQIYTHLGKFEEATNVYNELLALGKKSGEITFQVNALNKLGFIKGAILGNYDEGRKLMDKAEELSNVIQFEPGLLENYVLKCSIETATAQFESAEKYLTNAAILGEKLNNSESMLYGKTHTVNTYVFMTRYDDGLKLGLETLELAKELNNKRFQAELLSLSIPICHLRNGNMELAYNACLEGLKIAEEIGSAQYITYACFSLLEITPRLGKYQESLFYVQELISSSYNVGLPAWIAIAHAASAQMSIILGKPVEEIDQLFSESFKFTEQPSGKFLVAKIWHTYGLYKFEQGEFREAIKYFEMINEIPSTLMNFYRPTALLGTVLAYLKLGEIEKAFENLNMAEDYIKEREMKFLYSFLSFTRSKYSYSNENYEDALKNIKKAEMLALEYEYKPELVNIKIEYAFILKQLNRVKESDIKYKEGEEIIEGLAENIKDEKIKNQFKSTVTPLLKV